MNTQKYCEAVKGWPNEGNHVLADFDENSVVVYQAYRPEIGNFAVKNQYFGGAFKLTRMSWIKPNFLWMMYRSGWGQKKGQEVVLAVRMLREGFDQILRDAVHSSFKNHLYPSHEEWKTRVSESDVRLQWDPDHLPDGTKHQRRAIQLGLRGEALKSYSQEWIVEIEDVSEFAREQRENINRVDRLLVSKESPYPVPEAAAVHLEVTP